MKNRNENTTIPHISYTTIRYFLKLSFKQKKVLNKKIPCVKHGIFTIVNLLNFNKTKDLARS